MNFQRIRRQQWLRQAEGYLEFGMPQHALDTLARCGESRTLPGKAAYLRGEALRALNRHEDALVALERAWDQLEDSRVEIGLAIGWCYKRVGRVDLAIRALERVLVIDPGNALVLYNLACYWSLASNKRQAILFLSKALSIDAKYRELVAEESDFDNVRTDPAFRALTRVEV
jgi:tetratricopeptide (TPR) repeat protein